MQESRKKPGSQKEHWILSRKPIGAGTKENYVVYAQRSMLEDEFNKLWDFQSKYHDKLQDQKVKEIFHKAIFHQRQLKNLLWEYVLLLAMKKEYQNLYLLSKSLEY